MKNSLFHRSLSVLLLLAILIGYLPVGVLEAKAQESISPIAEEEPELRSPSTEEMLVPTYPEVADRYVLQGNPYGTYNGQSTTHMGGMTVVNKHIYFIKTTEDGSSFMMGRSHLTNRATASLNVDNVVANVGKAKAMSSATVSNTTFYLFLATGLSGSEALHCIHANSGNMILKSSFDVRDENGTSLTIDGVETLSVNNKQVTLLIRSGFSFYTVDLTVPGTSGALTAKFAFTIDDADAKAKASTLAGETPAAAVIDFEIFGMAKDSRDRLYLSARINCAPVILVYPELTSLIASGSQNVTADLNSSISVAAAGYEDYSLQDLSIHEDVVYFSSRQRWITSNNYRGSFGFLTNTEDLRFTREEAYRESGTYRIAGTKDQAYVIKTTADFGVVIEHKANATDKAYFFGFEPDEHGYWYIRTSVGVSGQSRVANLFITANDDGSVTLEPKREGDPSQLWYVNFAQMHASIADLKLYAIRSKKTGLYLNNNATDILKVEMGSKGKTFVLEQMINKADLQTYLFDAEFYKLAYPERAEGKTDADLKTDWENTTRALGYLGSPYFDPVYYLAHNTDVKNAYGADNYAKAYTHFVNNGYWEGRQGSLYFSAKYYVSIKENQDVYDAYFPLKEEIIRHYAEYGSVKACYLETRNGSEEFSLREYAEEFYPDATLNDGDVYLREYVASLIRLKNCESIDEFYDLVYDDQVYRMMNSVDLAPDKVGASASNYSEKLKNHWVKYGRAEGRTAGIIFNPSYYTTRYPEQVGSLSNAYEHYFNTGRAEGLVGSEYISMSTEADILCKHSYTAARRLTSCTAVCAIETFCAACLKIVNRVESPAIPHPNANGDSKCDLCAKTINDTLRDQSELLQLPFPGLDNELVEDTSIFAKSNANKPAGTYYMVQKNADGIYRVFDPLSQSNLGSFAATQVYEVGGRIVGADPDMGVYIYESPSNSNSVNHYYFRIENEYYLYYTTNPHRVIRSALTGTRNIHVTIEAGNTTIALRRNATLKDPETDSGTEREYWLCLEQMNGSEFFEWSLSNNNRTADDRFYLYRLIEDQLHVEGLYTALQRAVNYLPANTKYDGITYKNFCNKVDEIKELYLQYNGVSLTESELADKEALQDMINSKERELIDLMAILEINLQDSTIGYFKATMYNWNEDEMNALVSQLEGSDTKGFYFESGNNLNGTTAPFSVYESNALENILGKDTKSQMYSIYSGLAAEDLYTATNPPFRNDVVVAADYWSEKEIEGAKDVYTKVSVPFVYKDGYYTLDSDKNGVFFEGEPASETTLAILEKPIGNSWPGSVVYGNGVTGYQEETYYSFRPANNYVTSFQPFAKVSETSGYTYPASASALTMATPVDSYLIDGVAWNTGANGTFSGSGRGKVTWGFGMKLDIPFRMTENGKVTNDKNEEVPITFHFSGDDDVWVFIDGKLVMELGGSHDAIQGDINFATGEVIISSEKYGRIRDKNVNGYGRGADAAQYGAGNVTDMGSILTNNMRQKNIYDEVFNESVAEFAESREHTLTVYYMDRGKGRTNCAISFNLPQTVTVAAEKEIPAFYGNPDGTLTEKAISAETMAYLNDLDFGFTISQNDIPFSLEHYTIVNRDGETVGTGTTDRYGHFTLKNGQIAEFRNLEYKGQTYQVVEDSLNNRWADTQITATNYNKDGRMINRFVCTNVYVYNPKLNAAEQSYVMDYGKPIEIPVIDNAVFDLIPEEVAQTATISYIIQPLVDNKVNPEYTLLEGFTDASDYGTVTMLGKRSLRYTLSKMLDTKVQIQCKVSLTLDDMSEHTAKINIIILPATIMYYETAFLKDTAKSLTLTAYKPENDSHQWITKTADQGNDSLQDNGVSGDEVYLPVIDSEQIPSNAFFADFDGRGYDDRYGADPVYNDYDFDLPEHWRGATEGVSSVTVNSQKGTLELEISEEKPNLYRYAQTVVTGATSFHGEQPLHLIPAKDHYVQIRLRIENCVIANTEITPTFAVYFSDPTEEDVYRENQEFIKINLTNTEDLINGKYITLQKSLADLEIYQKADYIDAIRIQVYNVNPKEGSTGKIEVDYIYVGPEIGWYDSIDRESLYFGFDNSKSDQLRYSTALYSNKNLDEEGNSYWAAKHTVGTPTINNDEGTMTIGVPAVPQSGTSTGPFLMTTGKPGTFPGGGNGVEADSAILNFDPKNADYIQIRFKAENCTWSPNDDLHQLIFLYNYIGEDGTEAFATDITASFTLLHNGEYQTVRVAIPDDSAMRSAKTITAFGVRFRGTMGDQNRDGSFTIDELFLGSEEALNRLDDPVDHLFFDFTDSDEARIRYAASPYYGEYNFDDPVNRYWGIAYGADTTNDKTSESTGNSFAISDGIVEIAVPYAPKENQIRLGTTNIPSISTNNSKPGGYYPWHGSDYRMPLSFPAEIAEFAQVRFKLEDCTTISGDNIFASIILYYPIGNGETDFKIYHSAHVPITNGYITANIPINLPDTIDTIVGFGIAFRNIQSQAQGETGMISVDYIYVGKRVDAVPSAESLYITFDDTEEDRERYDTDTYGHVSPDYEDKAQWAINHDKVERIDIDNLTGTATLTAVPKGQRTLYDEEGKFIWPDVYTETGLNGNFHKGYLDYKPQNAEIFQIRFKMQNLVRAKNASGASISPYVKLFWLPSETSNSQEIVMACDSLSIDKTYLNNDTWITITGRIPEELRNHSSISAIRPYFGGIESMSETELGKVIIDYIYIGPDDRPDQVYGYDSHYNNDTTLSDGSSLFVEGSGVKVPSVTEVPYPNSYTEATFTFKGTGFDLISRTGVKQATIRVEVTDSTGTAVKKLTVNNKGELELYQIPVVSVQDLTYGTYTVTIWVNKAINSSYEALSRGGEFYFDAVRIYSPLEKDNSAQYKADREANNHIKEIRNLLISQATFEKLDDTGAEPIKGAVFIDVNSGKVDAEDGSVVDGTDNYITANVVDYNKIGPKNEVYLAPGQAVAFKLEVSKKTALESVDIGAKTIVPGSPNMQIGIIAKDAEGNFTISTKNTYTITSATAQYQEVPMHDIQVKSDEVYHPLYLVIYNISPGTVGTTAATATNNVISITDLKTAYRSTHSDSATLPGDNIGDTEIRKKNSEPEEDIIPVEITIDKDTMSAARYFLNAVAETPIMESNTNIYHSLNLASDISINYVVPKADLADFDSFYLECQIPIYSGNEYVHEKTVTLQPVDKGEYWYFVLDGLAAVHMNDVVSARLVMKSGARNYYSATDTYSIAQYATAQLGKNVSKELKTLCANLLRYGSAAQTYKGYRTDCLADRSLTESQKALLADLSTVTFGNNNSLMGQMASPKVIWKGKALLLDSKVTLRYLIDTSACDIPVEELSIHVTYTDYKGEEKTAIITDGQLYGTYTDLYAFDFDGLLAGELRTVLYATVYHGNTAVSDTLCYSVDTYNKSKPESLNTLCRALLAYSDSAKAFFGND